MNQEDDLLREVREIGDAIWRGNGKPSIVTRLEVLENQHKILLIAVSAIAAALIPIALQAIREVIK